MKRLLGTALLLVTPVAYGQTVTVSARETVDLIEPTTGLSVTTDAVRVEVSGLPKGAHSYRVTLVYDKEHASGLTLDQRGLTRQISKHDETGLVYWTETAPVKLLFPVGWGATPKQVRVETFIGMRETVSTVEVPAPR